MKCAVFVILCLISTLELSFARTTLPVEHYNKNVSEEKSGSPDDSVVPLSFPRVISENDDDSMEDLAPENRVGFGKVGDININSEENKPGIHAYGLPKKQIKGNGLIERIALSSDDHHNDESRSGRLIQAYGMERKRLESNGEIERAVPASLIRPNHPASAPARLPRSTESKENTEPKEDLEAQDSKVFRPLFVYRQQQARKIRKNSYKCRDGECSLHRSY